MNPFFFGDPQNPLYGVFHEPNEGSFKDTAVLCALCESVKSHHS